MIWLDNAAASYPKAPGAAEAVACALSAPAGNAGRPSSVPGLPAARIAFETREALAAFLGVRDSSRVVFTKNATEALNLAIFGSVPEGGRVAIGSTEHNAALRPVLRLRRTRGVELLVIPVDEAGNPDPDALRDAVAARPDLLVLSAACNVSGALSPYREVAELCRKRGVPALIDGSQLVGHIDVDLSEAAPAGFCFSGHKGLLGPEGVGCLVLGEGFDPEPLLYGGTGSDSAAEGMPDRAPERYEGGTQNAPALAGLGAALSFLSSENREARRETELTLRDALVRGIKDLPGSRVLGPGTGSDAVPVVSAAFEGLSPARVAAELGREGVAVRHGLHCAPWAHRALGTLDSGGTVRFSPSCLTRETEVERALEILRSVVR